MPSLVLASARLAHGTTLRQPGWERIAVRAPLSGRTVRSRKDTQLCEQLVVAQGFGGRAQRPAVALDSAVDFLVDLGLVLAEPVEGHPRYLHAFQRSSPVGVAVGHEPGSYGREARPFGQNEGKRGGQPGIRAQPPPSFASFLLTSVRPNGSGSCGSSSDGYSTGESPLNATQTG